ncbi:MAG: PIN domain-containing protein [Thermofilum sp.]
MWCTNSLIRSEEVFSGIIGTVGSASLRDSASVMPSDERLTGAAGALKCKYEGRVSLVDTYTLAAAKILGGILVTTDSRLAELKVVQVKLVRPS